MIDTNVLVSGLLSRTTPPSHLIDLWQDGEFVLRTSVEQIDELIGVTRYPKIRSTMKPALAGRLINEMCAISTTGPLVRQFPDRPILPIIISWRLQVMDQRTFWSPAASAICLCWADMREQRS